MATQSVEHHGVSDRWREGLRLLHPDDKDEERESAPAENLMLVELLAIPRKEDLVDPDPDRRGHDVRL